MPVKVCIYIMKQFNSFSHSGISVDPFCNHVTFDEFGGQILPTVLGCTRDRDYISFCDSRVYSTSTLPAAEYLVSTGAICPYRMIVCFLSSLFTQYFNSGSNFGSGLAPRIAGQSAVHDYCPYQRVRIVIVMYPVD